jgi:hypothetical protein
MKCSGRILNLFLLLSIPLLFWQCNDDEPAKGNGQLRIEMTDAPVDDENIKAVFVTVAEVYVDGQLWTGFDAKQTINLMEFQDGSVYSLGIAEVEANQEAQVSLVLDLDLDANGNAPGCYVLTQGDEKHDIAATSAADVTISISGMPMEIMDGSTSTAVIDFDLRKALRYGNANEPSSDYSFGTTLDLNSAARLVSKNKAGHIEGSCTDLVTTSDQIVVYAYAKDDYNREHEITAPADEQFARAVTSATVDAQGDYTLSWLEEGEYELVFASYKDDGNNGTMDLQGTLNLNTLLGLDLKSIMVGAASTVSVDVTVTGILPI